MAASHRPPVIESAMVVVAMPRSSGHPRCHREAQSAVESAPPTDQCRQRAATAATGQRERSPKLDPAERFRPTAGWIVRRTPGLARDGERVDESVAGHSRCRCRRSAESAGVIADQPWQPTAPAGGVSVGSVTAALYRVLMRSTVARFGPVLDTFPVGAYSRLLLARPCYGAVGGCRGSTADVLSLRADAGCVFRGVAGNYSDPNRDGELHCGLSVVPKRESKPSATCAVSLVKRERALIRRRRSLRTATPSVAVPRSQPTAAAAGRASVSSRQPVAVCLLQEADWSRRSTGSASIGSCWRGVRSRTHGQAPSRQSAGGC